MKAFILTLALAGVAATLPLNAQVTSTRLPTPSTSRGTTANGSWQVVSQDRNGNTIYERRTYDAYGNIVVQRARRDAYGNFSIIDTRTVQRNGNSNDCQYANTSGTVGDIIFGRNGTNGSNGTNGTYDCRNNRGAADGVWRQVGNGRNNNSVYERRTRDAYGNIVVQKARRNPDGTFRILSTRTVNNNQGVRNRGRGDDDDQGEDSRRGNHRSGDRYDNGNYRYNNGSQDYNSSDYRYSSNDKSEHKNHGKGKGKKGRD